MKDTSSSTRNRKRLSETANLVIGSLIFVLLVLLCVLAFFVFFAQGEMS